MALIESPSPIMSRRYFELNNINLRQHNDPFYTRENIIFPIQIGTICSLDNKNIIYLGNVCPNVLPPIINDMNVNIWSVPQPIRFSKNNSLTKLSNVPMILLENTIMTIPANTYIGTEYGIVRLIDELKVHAKCNNLFPIPIINNLPNPITNNIYLMQNTKFTPNTNNRKLQNRFSIMNDIIVNLQDGVNLNIGNMRYKYRNNTEYDNMTIKFIFPNNTAYVDHDDYSDNILNENTEICPEINSKIKLCSGNQILTDIGTVEIQSDVIFDF